MSYPVGVGPDGIIRCHHGEQVKFGTSGTGRNPGRQFCGCPRPQSVQCKYFCWADDPCLQKQLAQFSSAHHETSQPTPAKRKFSAQSIATPPDTVAKRLRMEAIQVGLREREQDQANTLPFTGGTSETQASDTPTEPAQDQERHQPYSFLGLSPSQGSEAGVPSTPKRRAPSPQLYGLRAERSSSALPTPLDTLKPAKRLQAQGSSASRQDPVTPTQHKGKERLNPKWDRFTAADEENPFDEMASSLRPRLEQERQDSLDSLGTSCTPTTGERIANAISGIQSAFRTFGDEFNQLDAANYIQRLERQKRALEIRDEAKSKRIGDLEIERDVLREKLRRLEEQYAKMK